VLVSGRNTQAGAEVAADIRKAGGKADFLAADLAQDASHIRAFAADATAALGGHIDILVNNAGIYPAGPTAALSDHDRDALLNVNIRAPHVLVAALAPAMAERGSGNIVNIGSWMARVGTSFTVLYTATKAAVEQLTRGWAAEFGPSGVRVNTVAPGGTATPGTDANQAMLEQLAAATPAGVPVTPADIAAAVAFIVSDDAAVIHGIALDVDGGLTATRLR